MKKYPEISFKIDIEEDINNAVNFVKHEHQAGRQFLLWFLPEDFQYILRKDFSEKEKSKIIREYTKYIYKTRRDKIKEGFKKAKKDWKIIERRYFKLIDGVFSGYPWPKGNYQGIISIYKMYPRYIKHKIFFFPYIHKIPKFSNKVIGHEIVHFIFFDYLEKNFNPKEDSKIKGKANNYIWKISEVFNNVIEGWEPYRKIIEIKTRPYPGTEKIFKKMKEQWKRKQDINWLLSQWFNK